MTVVALASVKGAPGVTTVSCLLGATWPRPDRVLVAECDPAGGDLAARFALSSRQGWKSLTAANRRRGLGGVLGEHLQELPGGLRVLVDGGPTTGDGARFADELLVDDSSSFEDGPWDVIVDLGRIVPGCRRQQRWLEAADHLLVVLRADAAAVLHLRQWGPALPLPDEDRMGLVLVGRQGHTDEEIRRCTSMNVVARLAEDRPAAAIVCGQPGPRQRVRRSPLVSDVAGLGAALLRRSAWGAGGAGEPFVGGRRSAAAEGSGTAPRDGEPLATARRWADRLKWPWPASRGATGGFARSDGPGVTASPTELEPSGCRNGAAEARP